jgi:hypothetical protein
VAGVSSEQPPVSMNSRSLRICLLAGVHGTVAAFGQAPPAGAANVNAQATEVGRAYIRYQQQLREIMPAAAENDRWWQTPVAAPNAETREKLSQANRVFNDAVRGPLGAEPLRPTGRDPRFTFLPEAKQEQVARIEQAYADQMSDIRREFGMARLPADAQRLTQAATDRERQLSAVLTSTEREMLDLRTSPSATTLRQRYGELIQSEDEFRKLYALQKAFDEKFSPDEMMFSARPTDIYRLRSEAEHKLVADIGDVVGESRAKAFRRAIDQDYTTIAALCRRLKLPPNAADDIMQVRDNYAAQSLVVNSESGLNFSDRRTLIQELHKEAQKEVAAILGKEGMEAYNPRSSWLRYLESGMAYSTDAKDARSSGSVASPSMGVYFVNSMTVTRPATSPSSTSGTTAPSATGSNPAGLETKTPPAKKSPSSTTAPEPARKSVTVPSSPADPATAPPK